MISVEGNKTKTGQKLLIDKCVQGNRKNLKKFCKDFGRSSVEARKESATNALKNTGTVLESGTNFGTAAGSKNADTATSTKRDVNFFHTGKGLFLGKLLWIFR